MRQVLRSIVRLVRPIRQPEGSADFHFYSYPFISEENRSWSEWTYALLKIHDPFEDVTIQTSLCRRADLGIEPRPPLFPCGAENTRRKLRFRGTSLLIASFQWSVFKFWEKWNFPAYASSQVFQSQSLELLNLLTISMKFNEEDRSDW